MNRLIYIFSILISFSSFSVAQTAPNFTITDTEGIEHKLYEDYLDKGKTVLIKLFFVDCPPCNNIAPLVQDLYVEWGEGEYDVEFIELSTRTFDANSDVANYKTKHSLTFPSAGSDGGSVEALEPYTSGTFGPFFGTPKFAIIAPDKSVNFSAGSSGSLANRLESLSNAIEDTGAEGKPTTTILPSVFNVQIANAFEEDETGIKAFVSSASDVSNSYEIDLVNNTLSITDLEAEFPGITDPVLRFEKSGTARDKVSPSDMLFLRKHILRIIEIADTDLFLAADANGDGDITPGDMLVLRKVILGILPEFPIGNFIIQPNNIPLTLNPGETQNFNIKAIKVGDLNGY